MQKKKVLIIERDFIPYCSNLGTVLRVLKMAEFLDEQGIEVYIQAAKGKELSYFGYKELLDRFTIRYVPDLLQQISTIAQSNAANSITSGAPAQQQTPSARDLVNRFLIPVVKELSIPDEGVFFAPKQAKHALRLIRENAIRNVIVSSPPHSTQIIGLIIKKRLKEKVNLIVDYRDTWNTTKIFRKNTRLGQYVNELLEASVLSASNHFVYCTHPMLGKINRKYFDMTEKALQVMNGFDLPDDLRTSLTPPKNERLTIGYFGAISDSDGGFRNPALFFEALARLKERVRIELYGSINISRKWRDILKDVICVHGMIPHAEARKKMREMDLLMLLHSEKEGADEVITGKFFDYLLAERPILSIGPEDMEASRMVKENRLGYAVNLYDPQDIVHTMEKITRDWKTNTLPFFKREQFDHFSRRGQYAGVLNILD